MKIRGTTITWEQDDITDALGMPRNAPCANCRHDRVWHNHGTGNRADLERLANCTHWDGRTKTGNCKCETYA